MPKRFSSPIFNSFVGLSIFIVVMGGLFLTPKKYSVLLSRLILPTSLNQKYPNNMNTDVIQQGERVFISERTRIEEFFKKEGASVLTLNKPPLHRIMLVEHQGPQWYAMYDELLGQGANGKVFLAQNIATHELLAVKQQLLIENATAIQNEIQQLTRLNDYRGEMILKELDIETHYLFSRAFPGTCIEKLYSTNADYTLREIFEMILASFYALKHLHDHHIVHDDIYEGNIVYNIHSKQAQWVDLASSITLAPGILAKRTRRREQRVLPSYHKPPEYDFEKGYTTDIYPLAYMSLRMILILSEQDQNLKKHFIKFKKESFEAIEKRYLPLIKEDTPQGKIFALLFRMMSREAEDRPTLEAAIHALEQQLSAMK